MCVLSNGVIRVVIVRLPFFLVTSLYFFVYFLITTVMALSSEHSHVLSHVRQHLEGMRHSPEELLFNAIAHLQDIQDRLVIARSSRYYRSVFKDRLQLSLGMATHAIQASFVAILLEFGNVPGGMPLIVEGEVVVVNEQWQPPSPGDTQPGSGGEVPSPPP